MSNINEGNTNVERNEDEANRWHRTQRSPTIVSSGSSLDSFLMDFQGGADFLDGMNEAMDNGVFSEGNRGELVIDEASQLLATQISTLSSGSLLDRQKTYVNASASHVMQRVASSDQLVLPTSSSVAAASSNVPEFLYQLTKMLAQDNREVIEWSNGT